VWTLNRARITEKDAITELLKEDSLNLVANQGNDSVVAAGMRQLDLSHCPRDFAVAYVDHLHAWEDAGQIQVALVKLNSDDYQVRAIAKSLIQKASKAKQTVMDEVIDTDQLLREAKAEIQARIHTTFNEVERVAVAYGVQLH